MAPETVVSLVQQAISGHRAVRITHCKDGDTEPTTRLVLPFFLVESSKGKVYLHGFCLLRQDERSFLTSRISNVVVGDKPVPSAIYQRVAHVLGLSVQRTGKILARAL